MVSIEVKAEVFAASAPPEPLILTAIMGGIKRPRRLMIFHDCCGRVTG
jgi:hypothetical protein